MQSIGNILEESLNLADRQFFEQSFLPACRALNLTAERVYQNSELLEPTFQKFIRENWRLISFMGKPPNAALPEMLPFGIRRVIPSLSIPNFLEETIIFSVRQTLATNRLPLEIGFENSNIFNVQGDKFLLPKSFLFAIIGSVVLHPANKNEQISDKFWINIWDFKMFISELWGRRDIADRVMQLYENQQFSPHT